MANEKITDKICKILNTYVIIIRLMKFNSIVKIPNTSFNVASTLTLTHNYYYITQFIKVRT